MSESNNNYNEYLKEKFNSGIPLNFYEQAKLNEIKLKEFTNAYQEKFITDYKAINIQIWCRAHVTN